MSDRILDALRDMAWHRAKGELESMYSTIYGDEKEYFRIKANIEKFIKAMEDGYDLILDDGLGNNG